MARANATTIFVLLWAAGAPALGQNSTASTAPTIEPPIPRWTVQLDASAWYVAPAGDLLLPGATQAPESFNIDYIDMDNPRLSPLIEVQIQRGPWTFAGGGFSFALGNHTAAAQQAGQLGDVSFAAGDLVESKLNFSSFDATAGYKLYETAMNPSGGIYAFVFRLDLLGGAQVFDLSTTIERSGISSSSDSEFFAEPIVGVKADAEVYKQFTVDLKTTIGGQPFGGRTSWSWDIFLGGVWRPVENAGVQLGFRQLLFDLQNGSGADEFRFRGGMSGLYRGLELRF